MGNLVGKVRVSRLVDSRHRLAATKDHWNHDGGRYGQVDQSQDRATAPRIVRARSERLKANNGTAVDPLADLKTVLGCYTAPSRGIALALAALQGKH